MPPIWIQFPPLNYICVHLNEGQLVPQKYPPHFIFLHFDLNIYLFCRFKKIDNKYLKKILIREHQPKSSIVSLYKKMEIKLAIEMAESSMKLSETPAASSQ